MDKKRIRRASFTVETACLMPLILMTIFGTLYLGFCTHNRSRLTSAACEAALSGSIAGLHDMTGVYEIAERKAAALMEAPFPGVDEIQMTISGADPVKVQYYFAEEDASFGFHWEVRAEAASRVVRPSELLRGQRNGGFFHE